MRRDDIIDRLSTIAGGGLMTDETSPSQEFFLRNLHSMREVAIREEFRRDNVINESNYQSFFPVFDNNVNAGCNGMYKFECPRVLRVNSVMSGFGYVGSESGNSPFLMYPSPDAFYNAQRHRVTRSKDQVSAYYDPSEGFIYANSPVKRFFVRMVAERPEDIYTFNVHLDDYPISMKAIEIMEEFIRNGSLGYILRIPGNKVSNSQSDKFLPQNNE